MEVTKNKFIKCSGKYLDTKVVPFGTDSDITVFYKNGKVRYTYDTLKDKVISDYKYELYDKE